MSTIACSCSIRYFWGLSIDTVAVINLVLAVGLSVDYAAHVAHSFMIKTGTRNERMVKVCVCCCRTVVVGVMQVCAGCTAVECRFFLLFCRCRSSVIAGTLWRRAVSLFLFITRSFFQRAAADTDLLFTSLPPHYLFQAVSDIGVAVVHGGISTFLAVVLLSFSASYVFRVSEG